MCSLTPFYQFSTYIFSGLQTHLNRLHYSFFQTAFPLPPLLPLLPLFLAWAAALALDFHATASGGALADIFHSVGPTNAFQRLFAPANAGERGSYICTTNITLSLHSSQTVLNAVQEGSVYLLLLLRIFRYNSRASGSRSLRKASSTEGAFDGGGVGSRYTSSVGSMHSG